MKNVDVEKVTLKIRNKETGATSNEVDINRVIFNQHDIEFNFDDDTTLPYSDFLWCADEFDVFVKTTATTYEEDE